MRLVLISFVFLNLLFNCGGKSEKITEDPTVSIEKTVTEKQVAMQLAYCYSCHNPKAESHDMLLAPPMVAVKKRYLMAYPEKEAFVKAVSSFAINPSKDHVLMRGAVGHYGMMAKAPFTEEQLREIATFFYENELEKPIWFDEHEQQMHRGGRGQGRGMGMNRDSVTMN